MWKDKTTLQSNIKHRTPNKLKKSDNS